MAELSTAGVEIRMDRFGPMAVVATCSEHGRIGLGEPSMVAFAAMGHAAVAHRRVGTAAGGGS